MAESSPEQLFYESDKLPLRKAESTSFCWSGASGQTLQISARLLFWITFMWRPSEALFDVEEWNRIPPKDIPSFGVLMMVLESAAWRFSSTSPWGFELEPKKKREVWLVICCVMKRNVQGVSSRLQDWAAQAIIKGFFFYFCKAVCLNLCWWWLIDHKGVLVCLFSGFMIVPWVRRASVFWSLLLWRSTPGADLLVVCSFYRSLQFGWDLMTDIVLFTFILCDQVCIKSAA